jgi:hypothetical protein
MGASDQAMTAEVLRGEEDFADGTASAPTVGAAWSGRRLETFDYHVPLGPTGNLIAMPGQLGSQASRPLRSG